MAIGLSRNTSGPDRRAPVNADRPPGFVSEPEALSETALKRWEREQLNDLTRRQANLNNLETVFQERKDSAQPRDDIWAKTKRLGKPTQKPLPKLFTAAGRHYNEFVPGADSWSLPGSGHLLDFADEDKDLAAEEAERELAASMHIQALRAVGLGLDYLINDASFGTGTTMPLPSESGINTSQYDHAASPLFGPFDPNALTPHSAKESGPPPKPRLRALRSIPSSLLTQHSPAS